MRDGFFPLHTSQGSLKATYMPKRVYYPLNREFGVLARTHCHYILTPLYHFSYRYPSALYTPGYIHPSDLASLVTLFVSFFAHIKNVCV